MKILPIVIVLAAAVLGVAASSAYLTPMYPVYALTPTATQSGVKPLRPVKVLERMASREAKMDSLKDKIASRSALFKERLAKFRDKVKANRLQNINNNLAHVNQVRTGVMLKHYNQMSEILTRVEDRVNDAANNGRNMDSAKSSISKARTALNDVKKLIDAQVTKDYTINLTDETAAKGDALASRQQLFNDLKSIHDQLITARQAIGDAIKAALTSMKGGSENGQQ